MRPEEIAGHWWLAEGGDGRVAGTLRFDGDGFPELDLMEAMTDDASSIAGAVVLGMSGDATPITAEVDFETNRSSSESLLGGRTVRQRLGITRAFLGAHLPSVADRQFRRITVSCTDLHSWTGWRGPIDEWAGTDRVIRYSRPKEVRATVRWGTVKLRDTLATEGHGLSGRTLRVGAGFLCEREDSVAVDTWFDEAIAPLRDFVSLMTDRPNQVEEVTAEWAEGKRYATLIYPPTPVDVPKARPGYPWEFPSTAAGLGTRFEYAIRRWLEGEAVLAPALDLYFSTQYRRSMHLETKLLNVAGATEAYHRRTVPITPDAREKHQARLNRVLVGADGPDERWFRRRLKHAYEPTFEDRLTDLATRASTVLSPWIGRARPFAKRVAEVRNLLVHQDPETKTEHPTGRELVELFEDTCLVFVVCLHQDLGFQDAEISQMLQRTRRWRELDFRKKGWRD